MSTISFYAKCNKYFSNNNIIKVGLEEPDKPIAFYAKCNKYFSNSNVINTSYSRKDTSITFYAKCNKYFSNNNIIEVSYNKPTNIISFCAKCSPYFSNTNTFETYYNKPSKNIILYAKCNKYFSDENIIKVYTKDLSADKVIELRAKCSPYFSNTNTISFYTTLTIGSHEFIAYATLYLEDNIFAQSVFYIDLQPVDISMDINVDSQVICNLDIDIDWEISTSLDTYFEDNILPRSQPVIDSTMDTTSREEISGENNIEIISIIDPVYLQSLSAVGSLSMTNTAKAVTLAPIVLQNVYPDVIGTDWYNSTLQDIFFGEVIEFDS